MSHKYPTVHRKWVRAEPGIVAGVFEGLGKQFHIDPWVLRIAFLISVVVFHFGILLYVLAAFILPHEDDPAYPDEKQVLGVCSSIAKLTGYETAPIRLAALFFVISSLGFGLIAYLAAYFYLAGTNKLVEE